jgi:GNAT superfamily N-acetyltransferase
MPVRVVRQEKMLFTWDETGSRVHVPDRLGFVPVSASRLGLFTHVMERVLQGSLDGWDRARLDCTAPSLVAQQYAAPEEAHFAYEVAWWQLAYDAAGDVVGFTQPVVYRDTSRHDASPGTIHYIGVVPEHRGRGYGKDLLSHATRTLQELGVRRIYSDTDVRNKPMIAAFLAVGYEQRTTRVVEHALEVPTGGLGPS